MATVLSIVVLVGLLVVVPLIGVAVGAATQQDTVVLLGGIAIALGPLLILVIWIAGLLARTNRVLLVAVFGPLLVLPNIALVPLVALNGAVLTYALAQFLPIAALICGGATLLGTLAMLNRALTLPIA